MKRETENKIVACANIMIGITILLMGLFAENPIYKNVSHNSIVGSFSLRTLYEAKTVYWLLAVLMVVIVLTGIVNIYVIIRNRKSKLFTINYVLLCISIIMIMYSIYNELRGFSSDIPFFGSYIFFGLFIVLGILALIQGIKRKNENITKKYVSIVSITTIVLSFVLVVAFSIYPLIGKVIYKHNNNEDEIIPNNDVWSTLQDTNNDVYINVKRNGKYGYINQNGKVVIDFRYDYATKFIEMNNNDNGKKYSVAIVTENGMTEIITKDETKLAAFKSMLNGNLLESVVLLGIVQKIILLQNSGLLNYINYTLSFSQIFYLSITLQTMQQEMETRVSLESYDSDTSANPTKYHYTDIYDVVETTQNDDTEKYELVNKNNENDRITLDCEVLGTSLFSNGGIPFFSTSIGEQGWFLPDGTKHTIKVANVRILDVTGNNILIEDYNKNCEYFIDYSGNIISPKYKAIGRISEDRYIVEDENNKCFVINSNLQKLTNGYDIILALPEINLCICGNVQGTEVEYKTIQDTFETQNLPGIDNTQKAYLEAQNINYELFDLNGNKVGTGYFQDVFDLSRQINSVSLSKDELTTSFVQLYSFFATNEYDYLYTQE